MTQPPPATRITVREMRERFNRGRYWERMRAGEFTQEVLEEGRPHAEVASKEPLGTVSQMVSYRDSNNDEVARVHQYLRPDGSIGASGLPDPKRLLEDGVLYRLIKQKSVPPDPAQ
jgi:hypothetical protein